MSRIPFELARINEGGGMNVETEVFVTPQDGMFRFSLSNILNMSLKNVYGSIYD